MMNEGPVIRTADVGDADRICGFGESHIRSHYTPLIGVQAADEQVTTWWTLRQIISAASNGMIIIAEIQDRIVAVAQHGRSGDDHVIYKLYVDPLFRGHGLGPTLIAAVIQALPSTARRICVEHFVSNVRAAAFYEREGFVVERVTPSATGRAELAVVWRARTVA